MPTYHRGRKVEVAHLVARRARAYHRHGDLSFRFPQADQPSFFVTNILPGGDQGNCGSCYLYSSCCVCSDALIRAGRLPLDAVKGFLSPQFGLDCERFGGCNGGDEGEVIDYIKTNGFPLTSDYGPYRGSESQCRDRSYTRYKIEDYGFCDPSSAANGVASTQMIKNSLLKYNNPVSVAGAAGGDWDGLGPNQTITGNSRDVNHAIKLFGWDDNHDNGDGSRGAWAMQNQWKGWGYTIQGVDDSCWIKYGADSIGTEAIWVNGGGVPPGPGPGPMPPPPPGQGVTIQFGGQTLTLPPGNYNLTGTQPTHGGDWVGCLGQFGATLSPVLLQAAMQFVACMVSQQGRRGPCDCGNSK